MVSTALAPRPEHRRNCELSVLTQTIMAAHIYIDAARMGGACSENVYHAVRSLSPDTIVLWVDGDDWLAHDEVIARVLREYKRGAWLTWGQFTYADGTPGWCQHRNPATPVRSQPWFFSHLKTFRAGLFQQIKKADLLNSQGWVDRAVDQAIMFPMLEMAGAVRGTFIPDPIYIYSGENTPLSDAAEGELEARRIRAMPAYKQLGVEPW